MQIVGHQIALLESIWLGSNLASLKDLGWDLPKQSVRSK